MFYVAGPTKLLIGDSLIKRLSSSDIKDCCIISRPGRTFASMTRDIRQGVVKVAQFSVVATVLGTNDVDNLVYSRFGPVGYKVRSRNHHAPAHPMTLSHKHDDFIHLMCTIKDFNPQASLVILAVIPRPGDWDWSKQFSYELNDYMQKWCCTQQDAGSNAIFVPAYGMFQKSGQPVRAYFAGDGIHLNESGLFRLRQCLRQALADHNIASKGSWKRKPKGRGQPSGKRRRKEVGNLVYF